MRVPMKVDYGIRALVELARHNPNGHLSTAEIARRQEIPEPYLDQLLSTLQKFGLIRSRRGPQGGHKLAKGSEQINLEMVVNTLEGTVEPLVCLEAPEECTLSSACAQREVWQIVGETVNNVLRSTTIADLAVRQQRLSGSGMYFI